MNEEERMGTSIYRESKRKKPVEEWELDYRQQVNARDDGKGGEGLVCLVYLACGLGMKRR